MKYILNNYNKKIPDDVLLKDIRKLARKHRSPSLTRALYRIEGTYNPSTIKHRFGTWNNALELAGLKIQKIPYIPTDYLMQNMKQIWDSLGRQPLLREMKPPDSLYSVTCYVKRFGSWQKALKAFIKYQKNHRGKRPVLKAILRKIRSRSKKRTWINLAMRHKILTRDNFKCMHCGNSPALTPGLILHVDHIIPVSQGGETIPENLQTLCSECNIGKGGK